MKRYNATREVLHYFVRKLCNFLVLSHSIKRHLITSQSYSKFPKGQDFFHHVIISPAMLKVLELKIKNNKNIYQELAIALAPHRERPVGSVLFIVEGTRNKPVIGIRYPGRKLVKKTPKFIRSNSVLWANLFDFEVVPFENGKEVTNFRFTFQELMKDFQENKMGNKDFWNMVEEL